MSGAKLADTLLLLVTVDLLLATYLGTLVLTFLPPPGITPLCVLDDFGIPPGFSLPP